MFRKIEFDLPEPQLMIIRASTYKEAFLKVFLTGTLFCNMNLSVLMKNINSTTKEYVLIYELITHLYTEEWCRDHMISQYDKTFTYNNLKKEEFSDLLEEGEDIYGDFYDILECEQSNFDRVSGEIFISDSYESSNILVQLFKMSNDIFEIGKKDLKSFIKKYGVDKIMDLHMAIFEPFNYEWHREQNDYIECLQINGVTFI
jgi:hypothetical protein